MALKQITLDTDNRLKLLIYGESGVGKTSLLRTFGEKDSVCTINAESGLMAVRDLVAEGKVNGVIIQDYKDFTECLEEFQYNEALKKRYNWIFIDSLTEIATKCFQNSRNEFKSNKFGIWDDYNFKMETLIKSFRDLEHYNVLFTCLDTLITNENQEVNLLPDLPGRALKKKVLSFFDMAFYMGIERDDPNWPEKRVFYTTSTDRFKAKRRSVKLDAIEEAHIAKLMAKIYG
jgi:nucleoside-triphosphatase THEP1